MTYKTSTIVKSLLVYCICPIILAFSGFCLGSYYSGRKHENLEMLRSICDLLNYDIHNTMVRQVKSGKLPLSSLWDVYHGDGTTLSRITVSPEEIHGILVKNGIEKHVKLIKFSEFESSGIVREKRFLWEESFNTSSPYGTSAIEYYSVFGAIRINDIRITEKAGKSVSYVLLIEYP